MFKLRDYQQNAVDSAIEWIKKSHESCVIEAATGAGKSLIVANIASYVSSRINKKILVLQPSKELTEQNREKYLYYGEPCSVWCASIGKNLKHDVIFGTPGSVKNSIDKFKGNVGLVIIDECHSINPTIEKIINDLKSETPRLRVVGLTATPYRMGTGYIYKYDEESKPVREDKTKDPYFHSLVYRITARHLISLGYLTPPTTESNTGYTVGDGNQAALDRAVEGQGRKTSVIINEVVDLAQDRKGVMIFTASIHHAKEVMESLPPLLSEMVTGDTPKKERELILKRFKEKKIKYIVNRDVLTTGFDAPHVDLVAVLRATESPGLFQQIIGRGLRLHEGKQDCLILDYAENIERHCPSGDIFEPEIKANKRDSEGEFIDVDCPTCLKTNEFKKRPNPDGYNISDDGYFMDLEGFKIDMPSHFGRRCKNFSFVGKEEHQCSYRWTLRRCPECDHENDIAARFCEECKEELVDPNEKLVIEFQKMKKDPYIRTTDKVVSWQVSEHFSQAGNQTVKVTYKTEFRAITVWYMPKKSRLWNDLCLAVFGRLTDTPEKFIRAINAGYGTMPKTITVKKNKTSNYYDVSAHNRPEDVEPCQ